MQLFLWSFLPLFLSFEEYLTKNSQAYVLYSKTSLRDYAAERDGLS